MTVEQLAEASRMDNQREVYIAASPDPPLCRAIELGLGEQLVALGVTDSTELPGFAGTFQDLCTIMALDYGSLPARIREEGRLIMAGSNDRLNAVHDTISRLGYYEAELEKQRTMPGVLPPKPPKELIAKVQQSQLFTEEKIVVPPGTAPESKEATAKILAFLRRPPNDQRLMVQERQEVGGAATAHERQQRELAAEECLVILNDLRNNPEWLSHIFERHIADESEITAADDRTLRDSYRNIMQCYSASWSRGILRVWQDFGIYLTEVNGGHPPDFTKVSMMNVHDFLSDMRGANMSTKHPLQALRWVRDHYHWRLKLTSPLLDKFDVHKAQGRRRTGQKESWHPALQYVFETGASVQPPAGGRYSMEQERDSACAVKMISGNRFRQCQRSILVEITADFIVFECNQQKRKGGAGDRAENFIWKVPKNGLFSKDYWKPLVQAMRPDLTDPSCPKLSPPRDYLFANKYITNRFDPESGTMPFATGPTIQRWMRTKIKKILPGWRAEYIDKVTLHGARRTINSWASCLKISSEERDILGLWNQKTMPRHYDDAVLLRQHRLRSEVFKCVQQSLGMKHDVWPKSAPVFSAKQIVHICDWTLGGFSSFAHNAISPSWNISGFAVNREQGERGYEFADFPVSDDEGEIETEMAEYRRRAGLPAVAHEGVGVMDADTDMPRQPPQNQPPAGMGGSPAAHDPLQPMVKKKAGRKPDTAEVKAEKAAARAEKRAAEVAQLAKDGAKKPKVAAGAPPPVVRSVLTRQQLAALPKAQGTAAKVKPKVVAAKVPAGKAVPPPKVPKAGPDPKLDTLQHVPMGYHMVPGDAKVDKDDDGVWTVSWPAAPQTYFLLRDPAAMTKIYVIAQSSIACGNTEYYLWCSNSKVKHKLFDKPGGGVVAQKGT